MSMNPLNDISQVYLEKVATVAEKKKDDSYLEADMKKRQANNEKARKELAKGPQMKNPHFEEKQLDPVGQEDSDVNNDKKVDKTDKYLLKRRKAIAKAMKEGTSKDIEVPSTDLKGAVKKAVKRIDTNVSGDVNKKDKSMGEFGEFVPSPDGKKRVTTKMEGYSNWRDDLREVVGQDSEDQKQVKERKIKNNITVNPKISEEVTILEITEMGEVDFAAYSEETSMQMSPQEIALQKRKAMVDQQIAQKRKQALSKVAQKRKQSLNKDVKEEVEEYVDFLITEGYDCSDLTWDDMYEEYQSLDEGLRSAVKKFFGGGKKEEPAKPMSRGDQLRKKYNVGPERSDTSAKAQILKRTRARAEKDQKEFGGSRYSKGVADRSKAAHQRQLKGGYSKYGADDARGKGNKARKRAASLTREEVVNEEGADSLKDRRMERGGVGGNQRYKNPVSNTPNTFGKKKPVVGGPSALDVVKAQIRAKHGKGAIMDTKNK